MSRVPFRAYLATFVRSFAIQGSWNYRTMLGQGFAFALLPVLRRVHGTSGEELERAVARHSAHFNAHPYLADVALGAVARMEADGTDPELIQRFKTAVRGPLGGLGDRLVWVGALPAAALAALVAVVAEAPVWLPPALFLLLYNAGHLALRAWSYRAGLRGGAQVAARIRGADLSHYAERLCGVSTFLTGALLGLALIGVVKGGLAVPTAAALAAAIGLLVLGVRRGQGVWRWAAVLTVALVSGALLTGLR